MNELHSHTLCDKNYLVRLLRDIWALSADCRKILQHDEKCVCLNNPGPKFQGALPKKNLGAKNMQNLAQFWVTFNFDGEYLRKGWRYLQSDQYMIYSDFSRVLRNKLGELWSTNFGVLVVESYPPKLTFSEEHISATRGCCAPIFLHTLENDPSFASTHPIRDRGPLHNFSQRGSQELAWNVAYEHQDLWSQGE